MGALRRPDLPSAAPRPPDQPSPAVHLPVLHPAAPRSAILRWLPLVLVATMAVVGLAIETVRDGSPLLASKLPIALLLLGAAWRLRRRSRV